MLLRLPNELLIIILYNLPSHSIIACRASCSQLHDVIGESRLLKWKIWSMDRGIQDLSTPGVSFDDRFSNVQKWENVWSNFKVRKAAGELSMSRPCQSLSGFDLHGVTDHEFLLRSGYLIHIIKLENPGWSHIQLSLQRKIRGFVPPEWTDVRLGSHVAMEGWALDLDQDLVAALLRFPGRRNRSEIHLMHFTNGKCHESANIPVVQLEFEGKYSHSFGTRMEIMGHHLVVLLAHKTQCLSYQTLYLVDWVKGHIICQQRFSANTYFPVLASISEDTFVLGLQRDWALALCRITKKGDTLTIRRLGLLKLPPIQQNTNIRLETFNRAPSGTGSPSALTCHSTLPLRSAPSESILSFYVVARNEEQNASSTLFFYAHPSDLRDLAEGAVRAHALEIEGRKTKMLYRSLLSLNPSSPVIVPWDDWGPRTTQWIDGKDALYQSLSGTRCAISMRSRGVQVLDFHRTRVKNWAVDKTDNATVVGTDEAVGGINEASLVGADRETVEPTKRLWMKSTKRLWVEPTKRLWSLWMKLTKRLGGTHEEAVDGTKGGIEGCFQHGTDIFSSKLPYDMLRRRGGEGRLLIDDQWIVHTQYKSDSNTEPQYSIWVHSLDNNGL